MSTYLYDGVLLQRKLLKVLPFGIWLSVLQDFMSHFVICKVSYIDHGVNLSPIQASFHRSQKHGIVDAKETHELISGPNPISEVGMICNADSIAVHEKQNAWMRPTHLVQVLMTGSFIRDVLVWHYEHFEELVGLCIPLLSYYSVTGRR